MDECTDASSQWSNDDILQMLELYKEEPCLWDPGNKSYKSRRAHTDAWKRILEQLPFKTTLDEVKKKKNSLMGYYRIHLNRLKKTLSQSENFSVYQTTWFAFELMHSFLSPIYGPKKNKTMSPASTTDDCEVSISFEVKSEPSSDESENPEMYIEDYQLGLVNEDMSLQPALYPEIYVDREATKKSTAAKHFIGNHIRPIEKAMKPPSKETNIYNEERFKKEFVKRDMDEYDHFGFMIAAKIRKVSSSPEREILMNSIQNLVFETYMKSHKNDN